MLKKSNNITVVGSEVGFAYQVVCGYVMKYQFDGCYHASMKVLHLDRINGRYVVGDEGCPLFDGSFNMDERVNPAKAYNTLMRMMRQQVKVVADAANA